MATPDSDVYSRSHITTLGRLLIVDDETELMTALCEALTGQGYEAQGFASGKDALQAMEDQDFDLLLTDLMMPEMDGIALLRAALERDPRLVGVIMTGQGTVQTAVEAMKIGAFDYVLKPFKLQALLPVLSRAMAVRQLQMENLQLKETVGIYELSQAIAYTRDLQTILNKVADAALQQCEADEVSIMLPTRKGDELYVATIRNGGREQILGKRVPMEQGIAGWVARCREPLVLQGEVQDPRFTPVHPRSDIRSAMCIPMLVGSKFVGVLNINATKLRRTFTLGQVKAVTILASTAAAALENAWLHAQMRESEERFRTSVENMLDGFGIYPAMRDESGRIVDFHVEYVNAAACALNRMTREEQVGKRLLELLPAHRDSGLFDEYCQVVETGNPLIKDSLICSDSFGGERLTRAFDIHAVKLGDGFAATWRDVTDRKQSEEKMQRQLARILLLNQITRAIAERQDLESIFRIVLARLEDNLPVDFVYMSLYEPEPDVLVIQVCGPKSLSMAAELDLSEGSVIDIKQTVLHPCLEGETVYLPDTEQVDAAAAQRMARVGLRSTVAVPLMVEGKILGVLRVARRSVDGFTSAECEFLRMVAEHVALASHQVQLYADLQEAYDEIRNTQRAVVEQERLRALGEMASGIAHDINNALSPIVGYVQLLRMGEPDLSDRAREYLDTIETSGRDIGHIVDRMREFYRKREATQPLVLVDVNQVARQVIDLTRAKWRDTPQQRGIVIEVQTDLQEDLPSVLGIESEIREALTNLIFNAVDAMPEGGVITLKTYGSMGVEKSGSPLETPGRPHTHTPTHVILEAADTGAGMDEETRRRCLEPFFSTKGERGTGLGLGMVFGVMQRHEGEINIESELGTGTTMRLIFPLREMEEANSAGWSEEDTKKMGPLRILCIDDESLIRGLLKEMLERDGHTVEVADGGQAGIDAFRAAEARGEPFDVVSTDLGMPYMDGREVAHTIRNLSSKTPIILLSGWGGWMNDDGEAPAQVDLVLSKPPKLNDLRAALRRVMVK